MSDEITRKNIDGERFNRPVPVLEFEPVHNPGRPTYIGRKRTFFTRAKDFVLGRTIPGKTFHAALIAAVGVFTGINIEPLLTLTGGNPMEMDLNITELILMAVVGLIGFLTSRELVKGLLQEILAEIRDIVEVAQAARDADSPGGKVITPAEKQLILKELDDLIMVLYRRLLRSRIAKLFGVKLEQKTP